MGRESYSIDNRQPEADIKRAAKRLAELDADTSRVIGAVVRWEHHKDGRSKMSIDIEYWRFKDGP